MGLRSYFNTSASPVIGPLQFRPLRINSSTWRFTSTTDKGKVVMGILRKVYNLVWLQEELRCSVCLLKS
jgi:hypothetical protein